jgi:hypothetical protein
VFKVFALLGSFIFMSVAQAQMGPVAARLISRPMPSKAPSGVQTFSAEAELIVSKKGRVDFVEIVASSGDPAFDKEWKKSLSDWRYVPAVDASGQPVESHSLVTYKNTGISERPTSADGSAAANVISETERMEKLTCHDFLWEYYIVANTLPRRLALMDSLLKTPVVMFTTEARPDAAQQQAIRERYDDLVNDAVKQCRDQPEAPVWANVFKPLLQSALGTP